MPINFGGGLPDPKSIPIEGLTQAATTVLAREGESLALYPGGKGYLPLRELSAQRFTQREGLEVSAEQVLITNGSMQALNLIAQAMTQPGDSVIIEEHCYSGTLGVFRKFGLRLEGVPLDGDGLILEALEDQVRSCIRKRRKPKFVYTIASHQNPTGSVLPVARRKQLLELAREYDIPIIEDHCYGDVRYESVSPTKGQWYEADVPSFFTLEPSDRVVYIGSYSKILGPGFRLGFVIGTESTLNQLMLWKMDGGISALTTMIVTEYFEGRLWEHVAQVNAILKAKRDAMLQALETNFRDCGSRTETVGSWRWVQHGEVGWSRPPGGLFVWMKLPEATDMDRLRSEFEKHELQVASGKSFHAGNEDIRYIRLAFGYPSLEQIREGIQRLRACVDRARAPISRNDPSGIPEQAKVATASVEAGKSPSIM